MEFAMKSICFLMIVVAIEVSSVSLSVADDWNQWLGATRDSRWSEADILTSVPENGLKELWRTPIASGFSGPAVAGDYVLVTDFVLNNGDPAFNAGKRSQLDGTERIHCLDRNTGKPIWQKSYERHYNFSYALGPRTTPTIDGDRLSLIHI